MASSDDETLRILESLINDFYSGSTSNDRKRELELMLSSFSARDDSVNYSLKFLTTSRNELTIMYCLSVIESAMTRYLTTQIVSNPPSASMINFYTNLKSSLMKYLISGNHTLPPFIMNKVAKLVVDIGKIDWPHGDPEFFNDVYSLIQVKATCPVGLLLLQVLLEEFTMIKDGEVSSARKNELQKLLMGQIPSMVSLLTNVIEVTLDKHILNETTATPPPSPTHHFGQSGHQSESLLINAFHLSLQKGNLHSSGKMPADSVRILSQCLNCLISLFSWSSFHDVSMINESLMAAIFVLATFGCHSSSSSSRVIDNGDTIQLGMLAMNCVNELIGKHVVMTGSSDFICNLFTNTFNILQSLIREENDISRSCDLQYISKFTDFLKTFLSNHFLRFETHSSFPLNDFVNCLFHFSFGPNSASRIFPCFELWNIFLDVILEKKRNIRDCASSNMFMNKYKSILITLLNEITAKMQYKHNSLFLETLKDEDDELLKEEDVETDIEETSQLTTAQRFINYCIEMISKIAQIIPIDSFNNISAIFFGNLSLYADLQYYIARSRANNNGEMLNESQVVKFDFEGNSFDSRKIHHSFQDLSSSLQAIGRFNNFFTHENFEERYMIARNVVDKLHQTLIYTNRFKLSSVKSCDTLLIHDLIQVHSQLLATLSAYTYWFLQLLNSDNDSLRDDFNNLVSSLIDECVYLIMHTNNDECRKSEVVSPPIVVHSALQLLSSIQETCRPQILLNSQSFHSLLKQTTASIKSHVQQDCLENSKALSLPVTREDELCLIVFLSKSLLIPWSHIVDCNQEWANRSLHHDLLIKSIVEPIKSVSLTHCHSFPPSTIDGQLLNSYIQQFLPLVTSVIKSHAESPSKSKQLLHSSITDLCTICGSLLGSYVNHPVIGSHLFDYFLAIFATLRSQVKKDFIENIVSIVLNVFSNLSPFNSQSNGTSSTILLEKLFKMLTFVVQQPMSNGMKSSLLPPITTLVVDQVAPHLMNNLLELTSCDVLTTLFEFLHELLLNNCKYFLKNDLNGLKANGESASQPEMQFLSIMKLYGSVFVTLSNDISLFKFNIHSMQVLNDKYKLFSWDIFRKYNLGTSFLTCFLSTLTQIDGSGKQSSPCNLMMDELTGIIYSLALVDVHSFRSSILPDFVHNHLESSREISTNQKHKLLNHDFVTKPLQDLPSFSLHLIQFANDVKHYRNITIASTHNNLSTDFPLNGYNQPLEVLNHGQ